MLMDSSNRHHHGRGVLFAAAIAMAIACGIARFGRNLGFCFASKLGKDREGFDELPHDGRRVVCAGEHRHST